jgi:drug/metabolite transporter (DMT)-like permease
VTTTSTTNVRLLGCLAIFGSTFFLYLSTLVIRWAQKVVSIDASYFVFSRFISGFVFVCAAMLVLGARPRIVNLHLLVGRSMTNCISVYFFYTAVSVTTVAEANILNMTYPLFVAVFAWIFYKDRRDIQATATLLIATGGVWLVLSPGGVGIDIDNTWGLMSGIFGAGAIIYLNLSRQHHDTHTILLFMFGLGALAIFIFFHQSIFWPSPKEAFFLLLCGASGVAGQYLLTLGFRYVTAVEGSVISSSRILMAAVLGPYLAADPALGIFGWIGAVLIFGTNVFLALRRVRFPRMGFLSKPEI